MKSVSSDTDLNQRIELVQKLLRGDFGEQAQVLAAQETLKQFHQQELIEFKSEVDIKKHQAVKEIDNDLDTKLLSALTQRFGKELGFDEVKKVISKMTGDSNEAVK